MLSFSQRHRLAHRLAPCAIAAALLGVAGVVQAQAADHRIPPAGDPTANGEGMDTHLFRSAVDSKGFFTVNGSDVLGANDVSLGLVLDYGHRIMRLETPTQAAAAGRPDHDGSALINNSFQGSFQFNYGIASLVSVGLTMPINLINGDQLTQVGPLGAPYNADQLDSQGFAGMAVHGKWRITRAERGIGLALLVQAGFGFSEGVSRDLGTDKVWFWPQAIVEKRFGSIGQLKFGLNVGYRGHTQSAPHFDQLDAGRFENANLLTGSFGVAYRALEATDLVVETYLTQLAGGASDSDLKISDEVVGGVKVFVERNSFLMLGGGIRTTKGFEAADQRGFIGFIFEPSIGDRDGDGFKDDVDKCPDDPEDFDGFKDEDGCPDPDNDNDGILDVKDQCPNIPEDRDGDHDEDGCPEGGEGDKDGDGILDSVDKCPDDPEDRDGFQDSDGCPDPDNDKDGILDKVDQCPNEPEDRDGFEDEDGCPDPDNDKDGILDVKDKCPNVPETYNGFEDEDGCPDKGKVIIQDNNIMILEKVLFKTASAEILPESNGILDAVATTVIHHPEFTLLEVQGHADERSDDTYNLRLTRDRAASVVEALAQRGVARDRMRSMGYGEYCPVDPAHNPVAWDKNRRVEFKVLKTLDGTTGVELGCQVARTHGVNPPPVP